MNHTAIRKSIFLIPLFALFLSMFPACGPDSDSFIKVQGINADGTPLSFDQQAQRLVCDSTVTMTPCETLRALDLVGDPNEPFRGVRIDYILATTKPNVTYASGLASNVIVYATRSVTDPTTNMASFVDSSIEGGQITFSHIASGPGDITNATFSDMVLQRPDANGVMQTLVTLSTGTLQYLQQ